MKQVLNIDEIVSNLNSNIQFYELTWNEYLRISNENLLNMKLIDLINLIKEKKLYFNFLINT